MRTFLLYGLAVFFVLAGANHFYSPEAYVAMVPDLLPAPRALVYISGVAEILGGLGVLHPRTRRYAAWGLIALLVAVFPANLNMAINDLPLGDRDLPAWALWARLPIQLLLIAWCWMFTRPPR
jgi:uncharacterized membrane protein